MDMGLAFLPQRKPHESGLARRSHRKPSLLSPQRQEPRRQGGSGSQRERWLSLTVRKHPRRWGLHELPMARRSAFRVNSLQLLARQPAAQEAPAGSSRTMGTWLPRHNSCRDSEDQSLECNPSLGVVSPDQEDEGPRFRWLIIQVIGHESLGHFQTRCSWEGSGLSQSRGWKLEPWIPIKEKHTKIGKLEDMRSLTKAFKATEIINTHFQPLSSPPRDEENKQKLLTASQHFPCADGTVSKFHGR